MPRFYCPTPLAGGQSLELPSGAARHARVLRLQPGAGITLFNGEGGEFDAVIERMGRSEVRVLVAQHRAIEREAPRAVHLAVGIPANERMDWLVEKAAELGAASIQPLLSERTVLRLSGERADRKRAALAVHRDRRVRAVRAQPRAAGARGAGAGAMAGPAARARDALVADTGERRARAAVGPRRKSRDTAVRARGRTDCGRRGAGPGRRIRARQPGPANTSR